MPNASSHDAPLSVPSYADRVNRLIRRWNPRGLLYSDATCREAVAKLKSPLLLDGNNAASQALQATERAEREKARRICDAAVHPVLEQPIPSAFRVCSLLPVTSLISVAMISTKSATAAILYHIFYQSHSAGTRYCNYADTTRNLDASRMQLAYAASTAAACGIAVGATRLLSRRPSLKLAALIVPHTAVACAGAVSTVMNAEVELREGVAVHDAHGKEVGVSVAAAKQTVSRAVLLHGVVVPACAMLLPVVAMRAFVAPRLMKRAPHMVWPTASALILGCGFVATPLVSAFVPPVVPLDSSSLEPELARQREGEVLYSSRELY